jgi:hypothetical protein
MGSIFWAVGPLSPYKDLKLNHKISSRLAQKASQPLPLLCFLPVAVLFFANAALAPQVNISQQ